MVDTKYIIAYDHGTSGMKTAIVSTTGEIMGFEVEEYPVYYPEPGAAEQNPMEWWQALVNTTHKLLDQNLVSVDDIVAVVTSNQMSGTIPIDKDGNLLHNCLTWLDTRGAPMIKKLCGGLIEISGYGISNLLRWIGRTGGAPTLGGKDCLAHILYLKQKQPDIYAKTWKFLDCKDWLTYKLTGKTVTSYDCGFLLWVMNNKDPNHFFYDKDLLKKVKLNVDQLPELQPSTFVVGPILPDVAGELGLNANTQVVLGAGDMSSAAVGSGAVLDNQAHVCIGSSSWIWAHIPERKLDITHMIASIPCAIPGRYIVGGEQETAGINLTWLRDKVLYHKDELLVEEQVPNVYKIFDKLVAEIDPNANNVLFTPWMFGERAPVEDSTVRGGLFNLSLDTDRRYIIRAVFEGIAFNSRWLLMYTEKLAGAKMDPIMMIGGGGTSDVWCQIYADILDRKIRQVAAPKEGNSIGAAFIASIALGYIKWEDIPGLIKVKQEFSPRPEYKKHYDKLFNEYIGIYKANKDMYKRLNKLE
ncbi:MAG TPA: FGGY-family carbohydrate kinase [Candidatus Lokiarchaeia archaeon]|nr:FGGY-family carbohydrate kinase [Candidatus Lokiarchaeia archaeon]